MSCNRCAATAEGVAPTAGAGHVEGNWARNRTHPQFCKDCHGFLRADGGCTRCETTVRCDGETLAAVHLTPEEQSAIAGAESLGRLLREGGFDPLNNDGVRRLHANYVSISCGQEREVVLDPAHPTAATDLNGKVYLNPYPLGPDINLVDQMVVAQSYIDHELLHELYTPREALTAIVAAAKNSDAPTLRGTRWDSLVTRGRALSPAGRAIVKDMLNILEDGRIERLCEQREPFMWQRLLAGQAIQPKDGHARNGGMARLKPYQQVMWATQIEVQPNYTLTPDIRRGMTDDALNTVRDLRPLIKKAGHGTAYDAVEASIEMVEELERRGLLVDGPASKPPPGMPVHEAGSGESADGEVAPEQLPGDWPDSGGEGETGSEDSPVSSKDSGSGGPDGSENGVDKGAEAGNDSGNGDAGSKDSGEAGFEDSPAGSEDSDGGGPDNPENSGGGGGNSGGEGEAGSEDSPVSSKDSSDGGPDGPENGVDKGAEAGNSDGVKKAGSEDSPAGSKDSGGERCPACGAFKTPGEPCENCERQQSAPPREISHGATPDRTMNVGEEIEETEETRRRQAELRRQAEAALAKARVGAVGDFRRAVKTVVKDAARRVGEKVAAGPTTVTLPFLDHDGNPTTLKVRTEPPEAIPNSYFEGTTAALKRALACLEQDRNAVGPGAAALAQALKKMRLEVEKTAYLKKEGDLDRRRMTAAIKGSDRLRMAPAPKRDLSMAVSISIDRSGSMYRAARELGTIAGILGRGLEKADVPYEMRSYTEQQFHHKTFAERRISDNNLAPLYSAGGGNDDPVSITLGGLALATRPEATKVQFVVTDGEPAASRMTGVKAPPQLGEEAVYSGVPEVHHAVRRNQAQGQIVQAIFYAKPSGKSRAEVAPKFDYMYGPGNWAYIAELKDLPRVVTQTLTAQMKQAG